MSNNPADTLVFTDMDGTLLDHHTYSIEPARPMLDYLNLHHIPVIPTTSKTFAELVELRIQHGLNGPFIIENGAAIYIPHGFFPKKPSGATWSDGYWCKSLSSPRLYWLKTVEGLKAEFENEFVGFNDMSIDDICLATGLSVADAEKSAQRQFGEPILFTGTEERKKAFIAAAKKRGANVLEGGRFIHICGDIDKGEAIRWFADIYQQQFNLKQAPMTIALGDSGNDIAMLEQADIAIRILSPTRQPPEIKKETGILLTSSLLGPEGWNEMLEHYFKNRP